MGRLVILLLLPFLTPSVGHSVITLNGPWRFSTGDNPRWSDPSFDDSAWEIIDLTAPSGAHDPDEGLTGYVPGWTARGHLGYGGYAWYRMRVSVRAAKGIQLEIATPPLVDQAYQLFINGKLLGGSGTFDGATPAVYATHPSVYPLQTHSALIAIRVWMSPRLAFAAGAGGIHIAPAIGESRAIDMLYQIQWFERIRAFVVEMLETSLFVLLAIVAACLIRFEPRNPAYPCLVVALLLTATVRGNLAFYALAHYETARIFVTLINGIIVPLWFGAWTLAWITWLQLQNHRWLVGLVVALTALFIAGQFFGISTISTNVRYLFGLTLLTAVYVGYRDRARETWFALPAMVPVACALFASELTTLGVPGIWFPLGAGLSRTEIAYAVLDLILFALLLGRLFRFAPASEAPATATRAL